MPSSLLTMGIGALVERRWKAIGFSISNSRSGFLVRFTVLVLKLLGDGPRLDRDDLLEVPDLSEEFDVRREESLVD